MRKYTTLFRCRKDIIGARTSSKKWAGDNEWPRWNKENFIWTIFENAGWNKNEKVI